MRGLPPLLSGNLVALCCMVLWATTFPVTHILLETWHPLLVTPARLVPGSLFFLLVTLLAGHGKAFRQAPWGTIFLIAGLGMGLGTTLIVWAQDYADPITVAIILTTFPLVSAIIGALSGEERLSAALLLGILSAIAGGVLMTLRPGVSGLDFRGGEILAVFSIILWAWFARAALTRLGALSDLARAAFCMTAASVVVSVIALAAVVSGAIEPRFDLSGRSIGLVLWLGVVSNGFTMVLWMTSSRLLGVTVAGIHLNGVPFYVILMTLAVGGALYMTQLWGACLVALGALLAQLPNLRRPARRRAIEGIGKKT